MLTHSSEEAKAYAADPLIAKSISAKILLELADTAQRIVADAGAIDVPVPMLAVDKDYVESEAPQRQFFDSLGSTLKRYVRLDNCYHPVFYESGTPTAIQASLEFIDACFATPQLTPAHYVNTDRIGPGASA